jgi:hypothetical protein
MVFIVSSLILERMYVGPSLRVKRSGFSQSWLLKAMLFDLFLLMKL